MGHNKTKKIKKRYTKNTSSYVSFEKDFIKSKLYQSQKNNSSVDTSLVKAIKSTFAPTKITAQNDYYTYINYLWLNMMQKQESKSKKHYFSQIDEFRVVQDKVYTDLNVIIKDYIKNNKTPRGTEVKNIYNSFIHLDEKPLNKHIHQFNNSYEQYVQENNIWQFLAWINKNEIISWSSPIVWTVMPDKKNGKIYSNNISGPQLTLYDYNLYLDDTDQTPKYIKFKRLIKGKYFAYINQIFDTTLGKNHGLSADDVFQVEVDIFNALMCSNIKNNSPDFYNIVNATDSVKLYGFNWIDFCSHLGYNKCPSTFICTNLSYLSCIMTQLNKDWTSQKWKSYWYYIFLKQAIRFHKKWRLIYYEFNEKLLSGVLVPFPVEVIAIFGMSFTFNTLLTEEYSKKFKNDAMIDYTKKMAEDLFEVFKRRINRHIWADPNSKKQALLKIEHINLIIGQPAKMRYDPLLNYDSDAWGNMLKIAQWKYDKYLKLEGKQVIDIPLIDWKTFKLMGKQPYIVNAFYTATENSIYIPLAILQKPFIDLEERGIEYNLAHIGYTLAHEVSHSLDANGSAYNYKGDLVNWKSPKDQANLKKIQDDITKQYEDFAKRDGIIFDASIAIGENMADIAGLGILEEYLKDFQDKNDDVIPIKDLSFQAFFVYVALSNKQHVYKDAIKSQLLINPHPLDKYRVNVPLSRLELFRSIYNIKKGDDMYWPSTSTIW